MNLYNYRGVKLDSYVYITVRFYNQFEYQGMFVF